MAGTDFRFERLDRRHPRKEFSCGVEALDRYFHRQAGQDQRRRIAVPYVLVDAATEAIAGYYTLSALSILPANLPGDLVVKLPHYSAFPAILIGRLAIDSRFRGQGLGELLLLDALHRSLEISARVGALAVVVDAKDDAARGFYERYDFQRFVDHPYRLFLPVATISQLRPP